MVSTAGRPLVGFLALLIVGFIVLWSIKSPAEQDRFGLLKNEGIARMAKKQKIDRLKELAAEDFEALEGEFDAEAFSERAEADMQHAYLAVASLHHTKEKLVQGWRDIPKEMAALAEASRDTGQRLRLLADMLESAHARLVCACAAVHS